MSLVEKPSIIAVPGLATTTPSFRSKLYKMAKRNGWDPDAVATVISSESGFKASAKNPNATASGLIQFIDSTAKALGVEGGAAAIREMTAVQQLPIIEKFYQRAFAGRTPRMVDFYLAGWGNGIGKDFNHILARSTDPLTFAGGTHNLYSLNRALDTNGDGFITVADLNNQLLRVQSRAQGRLSATSWTSTLGQVALGIVIPLGAMFGLHKVQQRKR